MTSYSLKKDSYSNKKRKFLKSNKETSKRVIDMGRMSTKENKTEYQLVREELGLTREKASELMQCTTPTE